MNHKDFNAELLQTLGLSNESAKIVMSEIMRLRQKADTWDHVLEMVRAQGFESVGEVLVKLDELEKTLR